MADVKINTEWKNLLQDEFKKDYFEKLINFVKAEYQQHRIFPPGNKIFAAFDHVPPSQVKVVILGQDPYHGYGQANGLSFSVNPGVRQPPSLKNIFKEIEDDLGIAIPQSGDLTRWANQGVFLLNATLTVREKQPASHQKQGWEEFTDTVIQQLANTQENIVFMLWGKFAQSKASFINTDKHLILTAPHPSPFSVHRGFFGCQHFSKANQFLESKGKTPIQW